MTPRTADGALVRLARAVLPPGARRWLRRAAREGPYLLRDFPRDVVETFAPRAFGGPLPPPGLRARVGLSSRAEFLFVGREGAREILEAVRRANGHSGSGDWLDFGCGCGRLARPLIESGVPKSYAGVDVDEAQIGWAARNLSGRFEVMRPDPPLPFASAAFDVVLAVSVFTHFTEAEQFAWLAEIRRLLRRGGRLVATTLPPENAASVQGLTAEERARLAERGFLAADHGASRFNEKSTFHARTYLEKHWAPAFRLRTHEPRGFVSYQDLSVWERGPDPPG